jgi:hypothetical protein
MATVYVTADWKRIVPEGSPEAAFGVQPKDLRRLGLDESAAAGTAPVDQAEAAPVLSVGGDTAPDADTKAAEPVEDKAAEPVEDKAVRRARGK